MKKLAYTAIAVVGYFCILIGVTNHDLEPWQMVLLGYVGLLCIAFSMWAWPDPKFGVHFWD